MTQNQIITVTARKNMVRARAGEIQLPKIVGFAVSYTHLTLPTTSRV